MPGSWPLGVCTDTFMRQWGIPCSHSLVRWVEITGTKIWVLEALEKTDFYQFWCLDSSLDEDLQILRLKEHKAFETSRGRHKNTGPFAIPASQSTELSAPSLCHQLSQWELLDLTASQLTDQTISQLTKQIKVLATNQIIRNGVQDMDKASRAVPGTADYEGMSGSISEPVVFLTD